MKSNYSDGQRPARGASGANFTNVAIDLFVVVLAACAVLLVGAMMIRDVGKVRADQARATNAEITEWVARGTSKKDRMRAWMAARARLHACECSAHQRAAILREIEFWSTVVDAPTTPFE